VAASVVRSTQFHHLLDRIFAATARFGFLLGGPILLQPIDPGEVARDLVRSIEQESWEEMREIGGPETACWARSHAPDGGHWPAAGAQFATDPRPPRVARGCAHRDPGATDDALDRAATS
jgi:hypothetical protein